MKFRDEAFRSFSGSLQGKHSISQEPESDLVIKEMEDIGPFGVHARSPEGMDIQRKLLEEKAEKITREGKI